ncbi:DegV family protein [Actinopolyspora mortivallis]|uniref:Fatty acid-binding protein DegV n=1 Tax=Actinopolyspora mortivallis TaxID=33906 RepID=A0A2T0GZH8_ACTMO|nr:DegV family protein [Actinopolyspora mortivallis]PRW64490.1 fatty acid-binding protein DegV [Actinopolyspora mortivallis]
MTTAVVTDSAAGLPPERAESHGVRVVPLHARVDDHPAGDGRILATDELTAALEQGRRVSTAGATVPELTRVYREALDSGADSVLSVHLSGRLSGTCDAARVAAREVDPVRIHVLDSRSVAMGLGFAVLAAAERAFSGATVSEVSGAAERAASRAAVLFSVRTLEYLRRGGRIGSAAALVGTALSVRPLLRVRDGAIEAVEKVRTTNRALNRLLELAVATAGAQPGVAVAVQHLAAPRRANELASSLVRRLPSCSDCVVSEIDPTVGAHIGPGALGVVVLPGGWHGADAESPPGAEDR